MLRNVGCVFIVLAALAFSGCATIPLAGDRYKKCEEIARSAGFESSYIKSGNFTLTVYSRIEKPQAPVNIYIEGDGLAYASRSRISMDPTPTDPTTLRLATMDPAANVVYIARPGQYCHGEVPDCGQEYWTTKRFSKEVVSSIGKTISEIKGKTGSREINLVGFSGGGAIVCLVAVGRNDVASIRTVAGNLDPDAVNKFHKVTKLKDSLNPMDVAFDIAYLPQRHFIGGRDTIIPPSVAYDFAKRSGDFKKNTVTIVPEAEHNNGWAGRWVELLGLPPVKPQE